MIDAVVQIDPPLDGRLNMSIDESLLDQASPGGPIQLRIYRWSTPTLSLGHFQENLEIPNNQDWSKISRVTRKTGGGAIVHDQELTYCLVVPQQSGVSCKGHSEVLYRSVHQHLVSGLRELGWQAQLSEDCTCKVGEFGGQQSFLCFERRSPVDVVVGKHKLIGSAQRRTRGGLLQHGSVLLRASRYTKHLTGLLDLAPSKDREFGVGSIDWGFWTGWLVDNLTKGVDNVSQCYWRLRPVDYNLMGGVIPKRLTKS